MPRQVAATFFLALLSGSTVLGQADPNIFNIQSREQKGATSGRVLTGFRLAGVRGILTAFHGVVGGKYISATSGAKTYAGLSVKSADMARDVALLSSSEIEHEPTTPGFQVAGVPPEYSEVFVNGYPLGLIYPLETKGSLRKPSLTLLGHLIPPGPALTEFETRRSPAIDKDVVSVQADIQPGLSGAPVFYLHHVVGIVNGGLLSGQSGIVWASVAKDIQWGPSGPAPDGAPPGYLLSGIADLPPDLPLTSTKGEQVAGGRVDSEVSIGEKGDATLRTKMQGTGCVTAAAALLDGSRTVMRSFGTSVCAPASAVGFAADQIPRDVLARLRSVALIHREGVRPPQSLVQDSLNTAALVAAKRVDIIPQKIMLRQDLAVSADGCSERSNTFAAISPGDLDLTRGGAGGAPAGFEFDIRGNNAREVRNVRQDGATVLFDAWTRGPGTEVAGLCIGAEGSNISVDVYAWVKTGGR